jgi:hypothetical protein
MEALVTSHSTDNKRKNNMSEETKEEVKELEPIELDPIWATLGPNPFDWKDDNFRQAYIAGCKCSYAGKMAGDMDANELRVFVGSLDNLCGQLHGALIAASAIDIIDPEVEAEVARLEQTEEKE